MVLLTPDNSIVTDAAAEAWLAELRATGPDAPLPPIVAAVASRARSKAVARARIQTPSGAWLTVRASVLDAHTVVTIEPTRPDELTPLIADAYGLTPRERMVTELVAQGQQTEAVAKTLDVSTWTVQDHLKSAFEKVGACSRGELVARIFFPRQPPRLTDV